ncbi:MAG: CRISPR-associated endonuclease Cas1 [Thermomicrobiales bacterium]
MVTTSNTIHVRAVPKNGVLVLTGYGIRIAIERGYLVISDGRGAERRGARFSRASRDLKRLVVIGHTGSVSFEALRWLHDVGCAFIQIDKDGEVIVASGAAGRDDPRLRRAQALATTNGVGLALARELLAHKLRGQAAVLDGHFDRVEAVSAVRSGLELLDRADTPDRLRQIEADAAATYWGAWSWISLRWGKRDAAHVPDHWQGFGIRTSPLTHSPRLAANPANALLNYAYAILEAEARIAALAVGLDPGLGVLHADLNARDSLALDLMEAVRPEVDRWVLNILTTRTLRKADFFETREGTCRLMPALAQHVAEIAPLCASAVAPVAERIAKVLVSPTQPRRAPTPLTEDNRRAGRSGAKRKATGLPRAALPAGCQGCGGVLGDAEGRYCEECLPERRVELGQQWAQGSLTTLAHLRETGRDPAHGGEAARKRAEQLAAHQTAVATWEATECETTRSLDFVRDVLPQLQTISVSRMATATGLSAGYCSFVRRGLKIPHRRHWEGLRLLAIDQER